jgi:hypothetical protein
LPIGSALISKLSAEKNLPPSISYPTLLSFMPMGRGVGLSRG